MNSKFDVLEKRPLKLLSVKHIDEEPKITLKRDYILKSPTTTLKDQYDESDSRWASAKVALRPVFGILLALIQCILLAIVFWLVSDVNDVSPLVTGNTRMLFQLLVGLPLSVYQSDPLIPRKKHAWAVFTRCLAGAVSVILLMFAVSYAPISDASCILNISPIFVALLAWIFLREKVSIIEMVFLAFIVVGAVFITRPAFIFNRFLDGSQSVAEIARAYPKHYLGLLLAGVSSLTAAVAIVSVRKISFLPLSLIVIDYAVIGLILTSVLSLSLKAYAPLPCHNYDRLRLIASALIGSVAQFFLYGALRYENAGIVSATTAMGIVFTFLLQVVAKAELPPWTSWVGAGFITFSIFGLGLRKWYVSKLGGPSKTERIRDPDTPVSKTRDSDTETKA